MDKCWWFLSLAVVFFFIRRFWTKRKKKLATERVVSRPLIEKKLAPLVRFDKDRVRSGMVGLIVLCEGENGDGVFFSGDLREDRGVTCRDTAENILSRVAVAPFRENVYKIPPLSEGVSELARGWLAIWKGLGFLAGTERQLARMCPDLLREDLDLEIITILTKET